MKKGHLFIRCPDTITIYFFKESLVRGIFSYDPPILGKKIHLKFLFSLGVLLVI